MWKTIYNGQEEGGIYTTLVYALGKIIEYRLVLGQDGRIRGS